jgi:hypothetical protein
MGLSRSGIRGKFVTDSSDARTAHAQRHYQHEAAVNDVVIHPNQGELISCDEAGSVKIFDLSASLCSHELVCVDKVVINRLTDICRCQQRMCPYVACR